MRKEAIKAIQKINRFLFKEKKKHHIIFSLVSVVLIIAFTLNLFFAGNNQTALGATYTFNQTSWAGNITANNAVHPTNQTSWNQFSASSTGMTTANSGADLQMLLVASSTIHTTDVDFSAGTVGASTTVSGASVKLNTGIDLGTGSDGALTVSSAGQNINTYASAGANNYSSGATSITVDSTTGFSTGDEILVIQMQHASNAGKYEFVDSITVVNSTTISFSTGLINSYYGTGSSGKTQVIRVPQYTNVTVNSGASIVPTAWSNATGKGGIVVFRANGTVTIAGSIDVSGKGFAGGTGGNNTSGIQGEGYGGLGIGSLSANNGGGGGGVYPYYSSGGGGGYGSNGSNGTTLDGNGQPGLGATAYGASTLVNFYLGGGGGGSSGHTAASACGLNGASGGGVLFISANSISVTGTLNASGNNGTAGGCGNPVGSGGGSGGSIYLNSLNMTIGTSLVQAVGGSGGNGFSSYDGGAGGNGRIRLDYSTLSGTTNPSVGYTAAAVVSDTSGVYTSSVVDYGANSNFTTLAYTKTIPTNTTLTIDIRAGNTSTPDGSWTSWQTGIASGGSISALNNNRYVQYRANLSRTDTSVNSSLDDITINYTQYATSTDLTFSSYNTSDSANILSSIQWTESLASGTDVKFQLRTAPDSSGSPGSWTSWLGPDGTNATYFTDPAGGEAMPSVFTSGGNDQWVQYKVFMTSTGVNTPTLSDVTLTYVVNATPSIQTITASQESNGTVSISYETKDTDTSSGTVNPGYITPSFEYWDGVSWSSITSGLATLATTTKAVNQSTFTSYSTVWTPSVLIGSQYYSAAKIRVTANDGEAANNTANAESSTFVLDTTAPVSASIIIRVADFPAS